MAPDPGCLLGAPVGLQVPARVFGELLPAGGRRHGEDTAGSRPQILGPLQPQPLQDAFGGAKSCLGKD